METTEDTVKRANFKSFAESTREDWQLIVSQREPLLSALPGRVTQQLELLRDDFGGFPVDRLEHSLQTATRAERDGRDDEYVMCALILILATYLHPITILI